jgi:DNA-binding transcriptional LysR family regulator
MTNMKKKIRELEAFDAFMRGGSMQAAGQMIGVSQAMISRLLSSLQESLDFELFYRRRNLYTATLDAERFHRSVERLLAHMKEVESTAKAISTRQMGDITIAASPIFCDTFLLDAIARFKKDHPLISVRLYDVGMVELLNMVRHQRCDFGLGITLGAEQAETEMTTLGRCEARCLLPKGHPADTGYALKVEDLNDVSFVDLHVGTPLRTQVDALFGQVGAHRNIAAEMRHLSGVVSLVERGVGCAISDPLSELSVDRTKVVSRRMQPSIEWDIALYCPVDLPLSVSALEFIEQIKAQIASMKQKGILLG